MAVQRVCSYWELPGVNQVLRLLRADPEFTPGLLDSHSLALFEQCLDVTAFDQQDTFVKRRAAERQSKLPGLFPHPKETGQLRMSYLQDLTGLLGSHLFLRALVSWSILLRLFSHCYLSSPAEAEMVSGRPENSLTLL
jgi:hypothetical protein